MNSYRELMGEIAVSASGILKNQKYICFIYGSTIYNFKKSDLDLCFFVEEIEQRKFLDLKNMILSIHLKNGLPIDDEVPFENKLVYTFDEVSSFLDKNIFKKEDTIEICEIIPYSNYLCSREMKARLLYNILTTKHDYILMNMTNSSVEDMKYKAWKLILETIFTYYETDNLSIDTLITNLKKDSKRKLEGEDFLGYKDDSVDKESLLTFIEKMHMEGFLRKEGNRIHIINLKAVVNNSYV
ncbi:hypothetical protein CN272_27950 [Bacillus anthracis]|nr:hypothetical protein CN272_27950 [Bacillus anthracis]